MTLQQILVSTRNPGIPLGTSQLIAKYSLVLSDIAALLLAALLATSLHWLRPDLEPTGLSALWESSIAGHRIQILVLLSGIAIGWFLMMGHYTRRRPFWDEFAEILRILFLLAALDATLQYITRLPFSRFWFVTVWISALALIPILRILTKTLLLRLNLWQRHAIVLGTGRNAVDAVAALKSERLMGYDIIAFATPRELTTADARTLRAGGEQIPIVRFNPSGLAELRDLGKATIVVAFEQEDLEQESKLIARLHRQCDDLHIVPAMRGLPLFGTRVHYFFRHELFFLTLGNNLSRPGARAVKRLFDMITASAILIVGLPIFAYLAALIRRDGGSTFFAHERIGQNGVPFRCLKFRTMVPNADAVLDQLLEQDSAAREEWNRDFKLRDDSRITGVGRFLRKYSLDELPQLWNVIKGEMSLVGPRPIVESEQERYGEDLEYYLETKPGMSGLWQISGRNDTGYETRVYLDTWYAKNWSLWMDIVILIKTARVVLKYEGAY